MKRTNVHSSNIKSVGYDEKTHILEIEFVSGGIYQYQNVSKELYERFLRARSKGSFFYTYIKDNKNYPYTRMK